MLITNFSKRDKAKYSLAITELNNSGVYIDKNAYDIHGNKIEALYALRSNALFNKYKLKEILNRMEVRWAITTKFDGDNKIYYLAEILCGDGYVYDWLDEKFPKRTEENNEGSTASLCIYMTREDAIKRLKFGNIKEKCRVVPFNINEDMMLFSEWLERQNINADKFYTEMSEKQQQEKKKEYEIYLHPWLGLYK